MNMMMGTLTASDISNEISMMRSSYKGTFLIVEGPTDSRLYSKFIDTDNVRIMVAHSKNNVVQSVNECRNRRKDGKVIGFVDRDMDPMLGKKRSPPIFCTDKRDMESTIMASPALDDILAEYGEHAKLDAFEEKYGKLSEVLAGSASPVGMLMYISYKRGLNLSFKDLDFSKFIDNHNLRIDIGRMVSEVYNISMPQSYPKSTIAELVRGSLSDIPDKWLIARGHDAVSVLRIALRSIVGSYNARNITDGELGGALRLAYSRQYFEKTGLFRESSEWCRENGLALWER